MPLYAEEKLLYNIRYTIMGGVAVNCMKCGRETKADDVFCLECLDHMERHPVPENMLVYVPSAKDRAAAAKKKTVTHPVVSVEEQVKRLHRKIEMHRLLLILFMGATIFFGILSIETLHELKLSNLIGKNYTTVIATGATDNVD